MLDRIGNIVSVYAAWDSNLSSPATGLAGVALTCEIYSINGLVSVLLNTYSIGAGIAEIAGKAVYLCDVSVDVTDNGLYVARWECTQANCEDIFVDVIHGEHFNATNLGGLIQVGL